MSFDVHLWKLLTINSYLAKRKSAVELLQETKSLYVKSEAVLDNEQRLVKSAKCDSQCLPSKIYSALSFST